MKIDSKITNIVEMSDFKKAATVVIEAFDDSEVKITLEIEVKYDLTTSIPEIKQSAKNSAIQACATLIRELEKKGYF